jgi:hypothetical protein
MMGMGSYDTDTGIVTPVDLTGYTFSVTVLKNRKLSPSSLVANISDNSTFDDTGYENNSWIELKIPGSAAGSLRTTPQKTYYRIRATSATQVTTILEVEVIDT